MSKHDDIYVAYHSQRKDEIPFFMGEDKLRLKDLGKLPKTKRNPSHRNPLSISSTNRKAASMSLK